ncbi:Rv3654c family TadE-like protein [Nocardioides sp. S-58]|uniref:Rv3654c family TadE-like protein n=1 Tax=Nocardioides renjunii TaxID=3095075 RepID=A0ABU5KGJ2_9ACTN|nr:Rv3654c family TadE-like protein [Nocardioides sp. S-58]MDZ5664082.1 Rv3654c family TadE-like protein [Nocardioides sp. S-58]
MSPGHESRVEHRLRRRRHEAGGATVLVVAMAGVLMFVMVGLAAAGGLVVAQRRAQAAADLAALAGASVSPVGCGEAARVAAANAAELDACVVAGTEVTVEVSVDGPAVPWRSVRVSAEARAGPGPG